MSERFKHLEGANQWPGLGTVDPFDLEVTFSPYLWTPGTRITLCRVPWSSTYDDVVAFASDTERDTWLDDHAGPSFELETEFRILPGQAIKLPIPFDVLQNFNYLYIDYRPAPVEYGAGADLHRFCFFIDDVAYVAPSTTSALITVDEWVTHLGQFSIDYIDLDRGHAPMAAVSASEFLSNPLGHMRHLATPDESTGAPASVIRHTAADVLNAGPLWAVITMTCDPEQDLGQKYTSGWRTATKNDSITQGALGFISFAVEPINVPNLLGNIDAYYPQVKPCIVALFLVPKRLVRIAYTHEFFGIPAYYLGEQPALDTLLNLTPEKFGYPQEYRNIAKLYTAPYAAIEVLDEDGHLSTIRVEDTTGTLQLSVAASIVAPMVGMDAHVVGIGGAGSTVTWRNFAEHDFQAYGRFEACMMHWSFPTYAILQDASISNDYRTYWGRRQQQQALDSSYTVQAANADGQLAMAGETIGRNAARLGQKQAADSTQLGIGFGYDTETRIADETKIVQDVAADANLAFALFQQQQNAAALTTSQTAATSAMAVTKAQLAEEVAAYNVVAAEVTGFASIIDSAVSLGAAAAGAAAGGSMSGMTGPSGGLISNTASVGYQTGNARYQSQFAGLDLQSAELVQAQTAASYSMQLSNSQDAYRASDLAMHTKEANALTRLRSGFAIAQGLKRDSLAAQQSAQSAILAGDNAILSAQAQRVHDLSMLGSATAKAQGEAAIEANLRSAALSTPIVVNQGGGSSTDITRPQAVWARVVTQDDGSISQAGDAFLRFGYRYGGRQWRVTSLTPMRKFSFWQGRAHIYDADVNDITRRIIEGIFDVGVTIWRSPDDIGRTSIYDNGGGA